jgi:DNA invertase Pin-like site-specific DNA recombinase
MKKAVIFCRSVSSITLKSQYQEVLSNVTKNYQIAETYLVEGRSGQVQLKKILDHLCKNKINTIFTPNLDRLTRSSEGMIEIAEWLKANYKRQIISQSGTLSTKSIFPFLVPTLLRKD